MVPRRSALTFRIPFRAHGHSLVTTIAALVLALTVPGLIFSAIVTWRLVEAEEARLETDIQQIEDDLAARLDRTMTGHFAMLQALASSPALDSGDLERFDRQARELLGLRGIHIVLREPGGQQRVNTRLPWGSPLPRTDRDTDRELVRTRTPRVSDLFVGATAREPLFSVDVPVLRGGELLYFLHASLSPRTILEEIRASGVAAPYSAAVVDRKAVIVARSEYHETLVGKPHQGLTGVTGERGKRWSITPLGTPVYASYQRLPLSGWLVSVGIEGSAFGAPLRRSLWLLAAMAAALSALALGTSYLVVRRMITAHQQLARAAQSVGDGVVIEAPRTALKEVNVIGAALAAASRRLSEQAQQLLGANQTLEARVGERTHALTEQAALLRESETRYRLLADHSNDMIVRNRLDGTREYVSPASRRLLGYEPEEMMGTPMSAVVHPDDREILLPEYRAVAEGRKDKGSATYRMVRKDGSVIWVEANFRPVLGADGAPVEIVGTVRDVSERREAAERLQESEALYRLLADYSTDMIVRNRVDGTREYVSPASRRLLGYEPQELMGKPMTEVIHPEDQPRVLATHRSFLEENRDHASATYRMRHRDGHWVWVEANVRPIRDDSGATTAVIGTMRDVSERQEAAARLRESETRYRLLAENATDMIVQADLDTTRRYVSPAARDLLGYEPNELVGTRPLDAVHPDDVESYGRILQGLSRGETDLAVSRQRYRRKDGSYVWTEANFRLIRDGTGEAKGYVAAVRDVSERERQAEELRAAKETAERALSQAQHASRSKSDFLAAMSHEIRTPLNSVIGFTNLLLEETGFTPEARRRLELIRASGSALLAVVNDILDFSKIEAGQIELDPGPVSVPALLDNAVSIIRGVATNKRIDIRADLDPEVPAFVVGDAGRLRQVLLNLMNNAVKFTDGGSVSVAVRNEGTTEDGVRLRFTVADTGIGIPSDKLGRLFERFSQVDSSITRRYGGTGLGLAISKRLIALMGGAIGVESVEGEGSTFWFTVTLPVGREGEAHGPGPSDLQALRPARILLVEDLDINQELARAVLEGAGHSVDVASNGQAAIEAVERNAYDVVLMDVQMPVMDGMTATQRIRALGGHCASLPIVAMTANVLPDQIARFKAAGMNDHVGKPFRKADLLLAINRCLEGRPAPFRPEDPIDASPVIDRETLDELIRLVGQAKAAGLLHKLERRLVESFDLGAAADPDRLAAEAHALVSSAGMLGFRALSDAARALEDACREGGDAVAAALPGAAAARDAALAAITPARDSLVGHSDAA